MWKGHGRGRGWGYKSRHAWCIQIVFKAIGLKDLQEGVQTEKRKRSEHIALGYSTPYSSPHYADQNENPRLGQAFPHHLKDEGW